MLLIDSADELRELIKNITHQLWNYPMQDY